MIIFFTIILSTILSVFILIRKGSSSHQRLPPGSLGLPIIGQSFGLLRALKYNTAEAWLEERIKKYGPISKLSLFGRPAVFIYGESANKFFFTSDATTLSTQQPESAKRILGERSIQELSGHDHKRLRNALMSFLRPESLKLYVSKMEKEVRKHIETHWQGKQSVKVFPLMKILAFDLSCSLLFGVESVELKAVLVKHFKELEQGLWAIPLNLPFTAYNRSLRASSRIQEAVKQVIRQKRVDLQQNGASNHQDLITCLVSISEQDNKEVMSEDEIVQNIIFVMLAAHETSAVLLTFMVRVLASDPTIYEAVSREQEEIAKNKASGELLTWEDLGKMKYTWRVALETMRVYPPVFGNFRRVLKDIEFGGYVIPRGWNVLWSTSMTHMDSNIFQEPSKFDPGRFENQASIPPYCYVPFGAGHRICPGYEFGKIEALITIHHLVTQFKWKLCSKDNFFNRNPGLTPTNGLPIQIEPKKPL